jgi:hypothetical protein
MHAPRSYSLRLYPTQRDCCMYTLHNSRCQYFAVKSLHFSYFIIVNHRISSPFTVVTHALLILVCSEARSDVGGAIAGHTMRRGREWRARSAFVIIIHHLDFSNFQWCPIDLRSEWQLPLQFAGWRDARERVKSASGLGFPRSAPSVMNWMGTFLCYRTCLRLSHRMPQRPYDVFCFLKNTRSSREI